MPPPVTVDASLCEKITTESNSTVYVHPLPELCICAKGRLAVRMSGTVYEVKAGETSVTPPYVENEELIIKGSEYSALWMQADEHTAYMHISGYAEEQGFYTQDAVILEPDYRYGHIMQEILEELNSDHEEKENIVKAYLLQLFILSMRAEKRQKLTKGEASSRKESVVRKVKHYLDEHMSESIRLEDVAKAVYISGNHLNALFKSVTGKTVMQYLEELRIREAKLLLTHSSLTIDGISKKLAFYDQFHFSRTFKKHTGKSPSTFKSEEIGE
jgi:AraC-like DNA-binding protein